jgi:glucosamine--fructose-6-phosphate aminotransferase (isomerizing)
MCGIIGYIGIEPAVPILVEGLKRLEYRGYDSAGVAVLSDEGFSVIKKKGRLTALEEALKDKQWQSSLDSFIGIGHTRWATHGEPSDINSHPHLGNQSKIAVVHNGIIENYKQLKEFLEKKGVSFVSQTDSEVIAQLAEFYYKGGILEMATKLAGKLEGSFALGIMCLDAPDTLIAIKKDNPLIIGVSEQGNFLASDVPAVLKHTDKVYYLNDFEIAVLKKDSLEFYNFDYEPLAKTLETITWSMDSAEKGGYQHFMLKEIMEQPRVLRDTINSALREDESWKNKQIFDNLDISHFNKFVITACGSAYNAAFVAKYVFEQLCGMTVEIDLASEFRYRDANVDERTLVILISQSGETADTLAALREAKSKGAMTLAIVNVVGSALAKEAALCIYTVAGPEIAVATTKAFSAQLVLLYLLAIKFAGALGKLDAKREQSLLNELSSIPEKVTTLLEQIEPIQNNARYASSRFAFVLPFVDRHRLAIVQLLHRRQQGAGYRQATQSGKKRHRGVNDRVARKA